MGSNLYSEHQPCLDLCIDFQCYLNYKGILNCIILVFGKILVVLDSEDSPAHLHSLTFYNLSGERFGN